MACTSCGQSEPSVTCVDCNPPVVECAEAQPCVEVISTDCVIHTGEDIVCGKDIVVAKDASLTTIFENIVAYFCAAGATYIGEDVVCSGTVIITEGDTYSVALKSVSDYFCDRVANVDKCCAANAAAIAEVSAYANTLVQSVTGLNTDNTDPRNPIVRVSVDGSTITGAGTPGDPLVATTGAVGSVLNGLYVDNTEAKLGGSLVEDTRIDMAVAGKYDFQLYGFYDYAAPGGGGPVLADDYEVFFKAGDKGAFALIEAYVQSSRDNTQSFFRLFKGNTQIGVTDLSPFPTFTYLTIDATNGATFIDSRQNRGIVYEADYSANYTNRSLVDKEYVDNKLVGYTGIYAEVGSYTNGYVPRWNAVTNTLESGNVRDSGNYVSIGSAPISNYKFRVFTAVDSYSIAGHNANPGGGVGLFGSTSGVTGNINYGVIGNASGSTLENIGVSGDSTQATTGTNIGIKSRSLNGANNYSAQLVDGTDTPGGGKFLRDMVE